jgi:enamine deaminase RidA (YjgF/YER057c/UK114 family)
MSDVVVHNGVAYLAGKFPADTDADIAGQTRDVLAVIDGLLEKAKTNKRRLLRAEIFLSDISNFDAMNSVWDTWVEPGFAPSRVTIEAKLAKREYLIEIMVTAAI